MTRCEMCNVPIGRPQPRIADGRLLRLCGDCVMTAKERSAPRYGLPFLGLLAIFVACVSAGFVAYFAGI